MPELTPGLMAAIFEKLGVQAEVAATAALTPLALMVERQAKINASNGEHSPRTPTPSTGDPEGPARVSGTLVRAITHTQPARTATGWEVLVGMATGLYPYYDRRTPANEYAYYLEVTGVGKDRKTYPFLEPALTFTTHVGVDIVFREAFAQLGLGI